MLFKKKHARFAYVWQNQKVADLDAQAIYRYIRKHTELGNLRN